MKRMKRIMALMLAAIMMMAMSVTAFAAEGATGTHTLTVNVKSTEPAQDLKILNFQGLIQHIGVGSFSK